MMCSPKHLLTLVLIISRLAGLGQVNNCGFKLSRKSKAEFLKQVRIGPHFDLVLDSVVQIVEIPVVFHVIKDDDDEFISDDRMIRELADMNRDFQLQNEDIANVPYEFKPLIGNPNIRFRLATVDPDGNATTGIIRKKANRNVYAFKKRAIFYADKIWDPKRYLNIYIGNIRNGRTRGYVLSFPWKFKDADAIALYFADVGKSTRLLTHETGHWFGLWHITEGGCGEVNDGIADTPRQYSFTNGCPAGKNECGNSCMFPNYMDYSSCRVAFTIGQAQRIRDVLYKYRLSLTRY